MIKLFYKKKKGIYNARYYSTCSFIVVERSLYLDIYQPSMKYNTIISVGTFFYDGMLSKTYYTKEEKIVYDSNVISQYCSYIKKISDYGKITL